MAIILNIETSGQVCSVAIGVDGVVEFQLAEDKGMKHAEMLAPFVERCMEEVTRRELKLDAVAVSIGPGSYTGLRIGLSLAKGLAFGLNIPLITIDTLQILAVAAMFAWRDWSGEELLVPMIDARRMEVYTAAYDFALHEVISPTPLILDQNSYSDLTSDRKLIFIGDASSKAKSVINRENVEWMDEIKLHARHMMPLSEKALRENNFASIAYSVPKYLKEYKTTMPKQKLF